MRRCRFSLPTAPRRRARKGEAFSIADRRTELKRQAKGYAPVPARLTKTEPFLLGHPEVGTLTFDATGRLIEDAPWAGR